MKRISLILTAATLLSSLSLRAEPHAKTSIEIISKRTLRFPGGPDGAPPASFTEYKKRVTLGSTPANQAMWLTDTHFAYDAKSPDKIEDVAIVQWIRGCLFRSSAVNGKVSKSLSITRDHFGKVVSFQHRDWEIDSDSFDPIYTSYQTYGRFALLRWNQDPSSFDRETSKWYGQVKSPHGVVFATDLPGGGFLSRGSGLKIGDAQNASLEFKTCLFHTRDLPLKTTPRGQGVDNSKAIWCADWNHKFVWSFSNGKMSSPQAIDPFCQVN